MNDIPAAAPAETDVPEELQATEAAEPTEAPELAEAPEPDEAAAPTSPSDETAEAAVETAEAAVETAEAAEATAEVAVASAAADTDEPPAKPAAVQRGRPRLKLEELSIGTETKGKVMRTAEFGAFVDIGAVTDGLVHVTELSDRRVRKVDDVVKSGDTVEVWIKEIDVTKSRISLSMKRRPSRPMDALKVGEPLTGHVKSLTKYGAFVDIGAETDGLVHVSEMGSGYTQSPNEVVQVGAEIEVWVKEIDAKLKRISLTMKDPATTTSSAPARGKSRSRSVPVENEMPDEPEGPAVPTMMELALRKAMGELEDEPTEPASGDQASTAAASTDSLGEVYHRMLEEYRSQKGEG